MCTRAIRPISHAVFKLKLVVIGCLRIVQNHKIVFCSLKYGTQSNQVIQDRYKMRKNF